MWAAYLTLVCLCLSGPSLGRAFGVRKIWRTAYYEQLGDASFVVFFVGLVIMGAVSVYGRHFRIGVWLLAFFAFGVLWPAFGQA